MYKSEHIITSRHYLIIMVAAFVAGIFVSLSSGISFAMLFASTCFLVAAFIVIFLRIFKKSIFKTKYILLPLTVLIFFMLGITRVFFIDFFSNNSLRKYANQELWLYGTVSSEPQLTSSKYYHTFELDVFRAGDNVSVSETIIVYLPQDRNCDFHTGDNIFFWAHLEEPDAAENASGYDYFTALRGKNIFLTANAKNLNRLTDCHHFSLITSLKHAGSFVRAKISAAADHLFTDDPQSSAILKGILIGDKSGFSDEMYDKFFSSGISHIVAVSGLHISILFSVLMLIFGAFRINRRILLLTTVPFIILFMAASAFTPSVSRASIMIIIMILSCVLSEEYNSPTALFAALGLIVAIAPYSIFSKSLVLSFSSTLGVFVYFRYINEVLIYTSKADKLSKNPKCRILKRLVFYLFSSLSLSSASFLGTAYFLVLFFGKISRVQFFTNLWIIPLVWIIFALGYVACITIYILPWLSVSVLKYPLTWCLEIVKMTINTFGDSRFIYNYPSEVSSFAHASIYFGGALMIYMILKALHDLREQKETAAEVSTAE